MARFISFLFPFLILYQPTEKAESIISFGDNSRLLLGEGISVEGYSLDGNRFLKVESNPAPNKTPVCLLASAQLTPGETYTYFIKGYNKSSGRVLLYVSHPNGNLLWPGADISSGVSKSVFTVPNDVRYCEVGLSFLYPQEESYVLIEDLALFKGNVESWEASGETIRLLVSNPKTWSIWVYLFLMTSMIFYFILNGKRFV